MNLIPNKPYVWVDKSESEPVIKFIYKIEENYGFTEESPIISYNEDTVFLDYFIDDEDGVQRDFPMQIRMNDEMRAMQKTTIRLHNQDGRLLGFHTVKPLDGDFSTEGNTPYPVPYTFLKVNSTDEVQVNIATDIPMDVKLERVELPENFDTYEARVILTYKITGDGSGGFYYHNQILNAETGYDPVLENIIVEVIVLDSDGNVDRKGHGTTHGSEGDASGEG